MNVSVSILIWKGNAFIPTLAPHEYGGKLSVDPVIITTPDLENLIPAIEESIERNLNQKTIQADRDVDNGDPILSATKARSWYKLAETGASYLISWTDDQIIVYMSMEGKKNKLQFDKDKIQEFPSNTKLENILQVILDDLKSRPAAILP
jgi:hypothetical protein